MYTQWSQNTTWKFLRHWKLHTEKVLGNKNVMTMLSLSAIKYKLSGKMQSLILFMMSIFSALNFLCCKYLLVVKYSLWLDFPHWEVVIHLEKNQSPVINILVTRMSSSQRKNNFFMPRKFSSSSKICIVPNVVK